MIQVAVAVMLVLEVPEVWRCRSVSSHPVVSAPTLSLASPSQNWPEVSVVFLLVPLGRFELNNDNHDLRSLQSQHH